jgi:hypothetical protein
VVTAFVLQMAGSRDGGGNRAVGGSRRQGRALRFFCNEMLAAAAGAMDVLRDRHRSPEQCREGYERNGEENAHESLLRIPKRAPRRVKRG